MPQRVLFISNGHGEDNHSAHVIRRLQEIVPQVEIAAMPIVGQGSAYQKLGIPIIGPTADVLPSGGFSYVDRRLLIKDIQAGLLGLTWRQFQAVRRYAPQCDLVHATGDSVGQSFAYLTGKPFISFISCLSALYEGTLKLDLIMPLLWRSPRCLGVFTRDPLTAADLQQQGFHKVQYGGIPSLDWLQPTGKDLQLNPDVPMAALLPGSRLPEAVENFKLQLRLVIEAAQLIGEGIQFRTALVPKLMAALPPIAQDLGWIWDDPWLRYDLGNGKIAQVGCYDDAFNDIVCATTVVIGMAGLAVDQAVAIGKPVIQIAGHGPQFTYAFAEAQDRLLGMSAQTIGTGPANQAILEEAAHCLQKTVKDRDYLQACEKSGRERLGIPGASHRIADFLIQQLASLSP
ncbi:MAG: lipid-A-disaccharide synthase-related protein [Synechocystis sp.]|nr:lipid-A-disaccharide synthase-related protein [Synechocystis sp.]